jgi:hypothetical protein
MSGRRVRRGSGRVARMEAKLTAVCGIVRSLESAIDKQEETMGRGGRDFTRRDACGVRVMTQREVVGALRAALGMP